MEHHPALNKRSGKWKRILKIMEVSRSNAGTMRANHTICFRLQSAAQICTRIFSMNIVSMYVVPTVEFKLFLTNLSLTSRFYSSDTKTSVSGIPMDDFRLFVYPSGDEQYVSNTARESPLFVQSLLASQECPPNYCSGFTVDIDSFSISCDTLFRGEAAGTAFNNYFTVHLVNHRSPPMNDEFIFSFAEFNDTLRQDPKLLVDWWSAQQFSMKAIKKIKAGNYRFTVTMLLKDGTLISKETDHIYFY